MLTVPEAAHRVGRNAETVRRWIRAGRLRSKKVGTQHVIDERDLDAVVDKPASLPVPDAWKTFDDGTPQPNWVTMLHRSRRGR